MAACSLCSKQPCITPPPQSSSEQNTVATALALQLANLPVSGNISENFQHVMSAVFQQLTDNNSAYYMTLCAIDCYLKEGQIGEDIAKQLAAGVQQKWLSVAVPPSAAPNRAQIPVEAVHTVFLDHMSPGLAPRIHEIRKKLGLE